MPGHSGFFREAKKAIPFPKSRQSLCLAFTSFPHRRCMGPCFQVRQLHLAPFRYHCRPKQQNLFSSHMPSDVQCPVLVRLAAHMTALPFLVRKENIVASIRAHRLKWEAASSVCCKAHTSQKQCAVPPDSPCLVVLEDAQKRHMKDPNNPENYIPATVQTWTAPVSYALHPVLAPPKWLDALHG